MDWKKTKNILILALLIMNAVLVYFIYFQEDVSATAADSLDKVRTLLAEREIDIDAVAYREYGAMPQYTVSKIRTDLATLSGLEDSGFVISERNDVLNLYLAIDTLSEEETQEKILKVMDLMGVSESNSHLTYDMWAYGKRVILYNQVTAGYVFDDGFVSFEILPDQYFLAKFQWLDITPTGEWLQGEVYPIEKAILSLIDQHADYMDPLKIESFEIVYHVDRQNEQLIDSLTESEPRLYWKAISENGDLYYFNGLR